MASSIKASSTGPFALVLAAPQCPWLIGGPKGGVIVHKEKNIPKLILCNRSSNRAARFEHADTLPVS